MTSSYEQVMSQARPNSKLQMTGLVTDDADVLDRDHEERITGKLRQSEHETKRQMVVVTVASLRGEDVATFTTKLADKWGVGRLGENDALILLIAPKERRVRIAVGYGWEGELTDEVCRNIIDHNIVPHFRAGDLATGIEVGVDALRRVLMPTSSS